MGQEIRFPVDIDVSTLSQLTQSNAQSAVDFLRLTDSNRRFSSAILKILIEDRRDAHSERVNIPVYGARVLFSPKRKPNLR